MPYFLRNMHFSLPQVKTLSTGGSIRIPHKSLSGSHRVYLTKAQHDAVSKAHQMGKGVSMKMSKTQLLHNAKNGGNIFSSIYKGIKHFVGRPQTRQAVINALRVPTSVRELPKKITGALLRRGANHFGNMLLPGMGYRIEGLADRGLKMFGMGVKGARGPSKKPAPRKGKGLFDSIGSVLGLGFKRKRKAPRKRLGKGLFSSIGNFLKTPSNVLGALGTLSRFTPFAPMSGPLAVAAMGSKLAGHGLKRKRVFKRRAGGSFLL